MGFVRFNRDRTAEIITQMNDAGKTLGYRSFRDLAIDYEWLLIMEGVIFSFTMFRLISLFRINRTVYLLWHTLGRTLQQGMPLLLLFIPTFAFFIIAANRI